MFLPTWLPVFLSHDLLNHPSFSAWLTSYAKPKTVVCQAGSLSIKPNRHQIVAWHP